MKLFTKWFESQHWFFDKNKMSFEELYYNL